MLQTINFQGSRQINTAATFFRYESGSAGGADESIRVRADGADLGLYWPGDAVELPRQCSTWDIEPITPGCTGAVRVGMGRVESARLLGNVRVVDSGVDKTRAGSQFVAAPSLNGIAGVFSIVTVYPTTKKAAIKRLMVSSSSAGFVYLGTGTGAPTTNPIAQGGMRNKLIGGATSDLQRALGTCASQPPTAAEVPGYSGLFTMPVTANVFVEVPLTTPIVLGAGQYLVVVGAAANANVAALIDWEELS